MAKTSVFRKIKKAFVLLVLLMTILTACQTNTPEPIAMSGTVSRINCILYCFDRYHEALFANAEIEIIEEAAERVMSIFRGAFPSDWLYAMQTQYEYGEWGIDNLLILIGSEVATARNAGDMQYEAALAEADSAVLNEVQEQILQWIHEKIEYFIITLI